jgi:TolB-like protein/tetratricopeptide (TPR) repeat protein
MGEVYRARDRKLDREVAIKVLPASVSKDAEALARFEREAKAVAALSHPNILAIHDFGSQDGTAYAVMELLDGETLAAKLGSGPLSPRQAVEYALQIARGLTAAHEKGVVHRDLKPDNVFVGRNGHVKILDFGLAKRQEKVAPGEETSVPTATAHTEPGLVMGTVGYMSPEQVRGLPLDPRSDIFSFGAILYEMLSGQKAFKKDTAVDTMSAITRDEPPELTQSGRNISPALDHIVRHCIEKDRNRRFQSAQDIAFALSEASSPMAVPSVAQAVVSERTGSRNVAIAAAVVVVLLVAGLFVWKRAKTGGTAASGVKRIAVLPFENLGSPDDDYFADGMTDEVRAKLTSLPGLEVIARGSSTPYKKTTKTPKQIAEELNAKYLLTATVRWQKGGGASRVHVTPELIEVREAEAPASKWQQPFDASLTDVFQVQSDIASKVAEALGVAMAEGQKKRLSEKPTQNLAAYDAFLKGDEASGALARHDPTSLRKAADFYGQAVALDPGFALAWARISWVDSRLYAAGVSTHEITERAREAAEKAIALAPDRPEGYLALGVYYRNIRNDPARALEEYTKGQRLSPGNPDLNRVIAVVDQQLGRWDQALELSRQAVLLDPRSEANLRNLGDVLLRARRWSEARQTLDRGLAIDPDNLELIELKAETFLGEGDLSRARAFLREAQNQVGPTVLVAHLANFDDLAWVLDAEQTALLRRLTPAAFDDNEGQWAICQAQACAFASETACTRDYAERARQGLEVQLRATPDDLNLLVSHFMALAYLGRKEEAVLEAEHARALWPPTRDLLHGPYVSHQLARVYILTGEHEKALDVLESLLKIPYRLSPGWLKIDPNFDPLRQNPRFQKLVEAK